MLKLNDPALLRRQVAWFQRQIFGQKSERRMPEPEGVQGTLGEAFDVVPDDAEPAKKTRIAAHEREPKNKNKNPVDGNDDAALFFDETKVPVEIIAVANDEAAGLDPADFEVIGEKISYRLAQRPGSYVILKYVRPVIKLSAGQALSCPLAPVGVLDGCRADVSFIAGMIIDKFAYHQPLYRQHVKLQDAGSGIAGRADLRCPAGVGEALARARHGRNADQGRACRSREDESGVLLARRGWTG